MNECRRGRKKDAQCSRTSNSAPMITGAKCFDIYRLPLLPDRFANGSRWRVAWRGGGKKRRKTWSGALVGYIFWREAKDNGYGNDDLKE